MSEQSQFKFDLRRNVSTEKANTAIYDKLKSNAHSPFYQMPYTKSFIVAMAIGIKKGAHPKLKEKNPNVYCDAFTDEEKWMMIALFMKKNPKLGVKALFEPDAILDLAEEYANGGIKYLDIIYEETTEPIDALEDELRRHENFSIKKK